jgi:hypothetical protein
MAEDCAMPVQSDGGLHTGPTPSAAQTGIDSSRVLAVFDRSMTLRATVPSRLLFLAPAGRCSLQVDAHLAIAFGRVIRDAGKAHGRFDGVSLRRRRGLDRLVSGAQVGARVMLGHDEPGAFRVDRGIDIELSDVHGNADADAGAGRGTAGVLADFAAGDLSGPRPGAARSRMPSTEAGTNLVERLGCLSSDLVFRICMM